MLVLIADGDVARLADRTEQLRLDGHTVITATTVAATHAQLTRAPDLLVLAALEDSLQSLALLRELRAGELPDANPATATVTFGGATERLATAHYRAGADITLPESAGATLLSAAVTALTTRRAAAGAEPVTPLLTRQGALTIDHAARAATLHERPVALTRREFDLLTALAQEPGTVRTREDLGRRVWGWVAVSVHSRVIDSTAGRLRNKLVAGGADPRVIQSVHGVGYCLNPPSPPTTLER